jgi:glycosidase
MPAFRSRGVSHVHLPLNILNSCNLRSLATDTDYVQGRIAAYLKDLLSLGVTGLRMDAAKHIASSDIANIFSRVGPIPYVTQEVRSTCSPEIKIHLTF